MPLSRDPAARERQLANLKRGGHLPAPPAANRRAVSHGGYAEIATERLDAKAREVFAALSADAPVRDAAGELPAADAVSVRLLAECLCRLDDVGAHLRDRGLFDDEGAMRPAVELERRLRLEAADHADSLAMSPRSRARLGVDTARAFDLAQHWAEGEDVIEGEASDA